MAFATHWKISFKDHVDGETVEVLIQEDGWATAAVNLIGTANPAILQWRTNSRSIFNPILTSFLELSFVINDSDELTDLYEREYKYFKVLVTKDGTTIWTGWIKPDTYDIEFKGLPKILKITAVDGLAILKDEPYKDGNSFYTGKIDLLSFFAIVTDKIGIDLDFRLVDNLYEKNHTTGTATTPLNQTYIDQDLFSVGGQEQSTWDVLKAVLEHKGLRIYQADNFWNITRTIEQTEAVQRVRYQSDGSHVSTELAYDPVLELTGNSVLPENRIDWINNNTVLDIDFAKGQIIINFDKDYRKINKVFKFREDQWINDTSLNDWSSSGVEKDFKTKYFENDSLYYPVIFDNLASYIRTTPDLDAPEVGTIVDYIRMFISYRMDGDTSDTVTSGTLRFSIQNVTTGDYLDSDGNWNASVTVITVEDNIASNEYKSYELTFSHDTSADVYDVIIYGNPEPNSLNTVLREFFIEHVVTDNDGAVDLVDNTEQLSYTRDSNIPANLELDIALGDIKKDSGDVDTGRRSYNSDISAITPQTFWNGLYWDNSGDYEPTSQWGDTEEQIQSVLLNNYSQQYLANRRSLLGIIKGGQLTPSITIKEPKDNDRLYSIIKESYNLKRQEFDIELIMLNIADQVNIVDELNLGIHDETGNTIAGVEFV